MNLLGLTESTKNPYDVTDDEVSGLKGSEPAPQRLLTNWCKTIYYSPAQIPSHPNRREIGEQMAMMEGKMMEQWKIMEDVRRRVTEKWRGKASKDEIEYKVRMEAQAEMQRRMQEEVRKMIESRIGSNRPPGMMPPGMQMPRGMPMPPHVMMQKPPAPPQAPPQ